MLKSHSDHVLQPGYCQREGEIEGGVEGERHFALNRVVEEI